MRLAALGLVAMSLGLFAEDQPQPESQPETPAVLDLIPVGEPVVDFGGKRRLILVGGGPAKRSYGPEQAEGPPDTEGSGDRTTAWASLSQDGQVEWLVCKYESPVNVRSIIVHANYNPGSLVKVTAFNPKGEEVVAWEGEDPTPRSKPRGISVIPVKLPFPVKQIKLSLDSVNVPGWNEIDAVGLEDTDGNTHWAKRVEASTTYAGGSGGVASGKPGYSPLQACGEPDTPNPGDQSTAWASATPDGQNEWMTPEFETADKPSEIVVYENTAPGAITKITAFDEKGKEVVLWEGVDPTPRDQPWGVSVFPVNPEFAFRKIKLYINSREVPGYNEIDAIGLRALNGDTQWARAAEASTAYGQQTNLGAAMQAMMAPESADELKKEIDRLQKEIEDLKSVRTDVEALKEQLKALKKAP